MKSYHTYSFEKLEVWQLARELKKEFYIITSDFPKHEIFGLTSQIRRSVSSITSNLAEGSGRVGPQDKAKFTNHSYSSALETIDHLIGAYDLGYIEQSIYEENRVAMDQILNKLNALYKYQIKNEINIKSQL